MNEALDERRHRANEAYHDASGQGDNGWRAAEIAIETATRVRIDKTIIGAAGSTANDLLFFRPAGEPMPDPDERWKIILTAAFRAAGFEVEQ